MDRIVVGNVMKVTLTCDHRVVDGATGAAFLQTLQTLLDRAAAYAGLIRLNVIYIEGLTDKWGLFLFVEAFS